MGRFHQLQPLSNPNARSSADQVLKLSLPKLRYVMLQSLPLFHAKAGLEKSLNNQPLPGQSVLSLAEVVNKQVTLLLYANFLTSEDKLLNFEEKSADKTAQCILALTGVVGVNGPCVLLPVELDKNKEPGSVKEVLQVLVDVPEWMSFSLIHPMVCSKHLPQLPTVLSMSWPVTMVLVAVLSGPVGLTVAQMDLFQSDYDGRVTNVLVSGRMKRKTAKLELPLKIS